MRKAVLVIRRRGWIVLGVACAITALIVGAVQAIDPSPAELDDPFDHSIVGNSEPVGTFGMANWRTENVIISGIDVSLWPEIHLFVDVLDENGFPIPGIPEEDFCVTEDGIVVDADVTVVGGQNCPTSVCLVVDISGSMSEELPALKAAALSFVGNMDAFDRAAIVAYSDCVELRQDFTGNTTLLENAINGLQLINMTAAFDGVWYGVDVTEGEIGAKAVIAFSDGQENYSHNCWPPPNGIQLDDDYTDDCAMIVAKAVAAGIPAYTITLGSDQWAEPMQCFANGTGGYYMHAPTVGEMDSLYARIKGGLCARYEIAYISPDTNPTGDTHFPQVCIYQPACDNCDTTQYVEPCLPTIALTQPTLDLEMSCQPIGVGFSICADLDPCAGHQIEEAKIFWRIIGSMDPFSDTDLVPMGGDTYCYNLPGQPTGSPGVEYYLTAYNGFQVVSEPPTDPQSAPHQITICPNEPPVIDHVPVACAESGIGFGVTANVTDGTDFVATCVLFYKNGSDIFYTSDPMGPQGGGVWSGFIPGGVVDANGVDYYIRAWDNHGSFTSHGPHHVAICDDPCEPAVLVLGSYETVDYIPPFWTVRVELLNQGPGDARSVAAEMGSGIPWLNIPDPNCFYCVVPEGGSDWGAVGDTYMFDLTNYPGGSFNVWFDVTYEDTCGNQYQVHLDPVFDPTVSTGVAAGDLPATYRLMANRPNPFNPTTEIAFELPRDVRADLVIYNTAGQLVRTLWMGDLPQGTHSFVWSGIADDGRDAPSGAYFYVLRSEEFTESKRMVLIR